MNRFQNLLVSLSLKDEDRAALSWAGEVARLAGSAQITALHTWTPVDVPAELQQRYPWLMEPGTENLRARMQEIVARDLRLPDDTGLVCEVQQGSALGEVLEMAEQGEVDLVICGRGDEGMRISEKLARKAPCSVLSVPSVAPQQVRRILVAIDFSDYSNEALEIALAFARAAGARLTLLHAFTIPWGEAKATTARPEIIEEFRALREARLHRKTARLKITDVELDYVVVDSSSPANAVNDAVEAGSHDLVVIGCRGRHAIYATLLGSNAESILHRCPVPVVAVKSKNSTRDFLAVLRGG